MTVSINYGSVADAASPYDATASSSGAVGDILICAATSYEFDSATPGSRTLAMVTAGWTQLGIEEFSIYPTAPNRRIHLALWYKVATTTTDTANVTLSGATYVFLSLNVGIIRLNGLPNIVTAVSALTRRDNIDLGVNPALTWTHTPTPASAIQTSLLIRFSSNPITNTAPTGYALPAHVGGSLVPYMQLHGGDTSCFAFYRTGPTSTVTFANDNGCSIVSSLTLDFDYPVLTHTGAMTT